MKSLKIILQHIQHLMEAKTSDIKIMKETRIPAVMIKMVIKQVNLLKIKMVAVTAQPIAKTARLRLNGHEMRTDLAKPLHMLATVNLCVKHGNKLQRYNY